ncbi:acyl carrier protein [Streptomyces sp. NPDC090036]|uniref:acyl carrier protein n=1 Tax=Streptomyces sp. NPDC090036 TaxID=3365926 RepID=UPI0037FFB8C8
MIGTDEIRRLLTQHRIVPGTFEELGPDTPLTLDSLALVWLQHALDEEHGISIDPYGPDLDLFTSARGISTYLARLGDEVRRATTAEDGIHAH